MPAIIASAGHQDRPEARARGLDAGLEGAVRRRPTLFGEGHQQDRVGHRDADRHDRPHERLEVDRRPRRGEHHRHAGQHRRRRRRRPRAPAAPTGSWPSAAGGSRRWPTARPMASPWSISRIGAIWPRTSTVAPRGGAPRRPMAASMCAAPAQVLARDVGRHADHPLHVVAVVLAGDRALLDPGDVAEQRVARRPPDRDARPRRSIVICGCGTSTCTW